MRSKAYAILPYPELRTLTEQFSSELKLDIKIREGNLEDALPAIYEAEREGAEVIISRGGTSEIIRKHIHIPVVDIPVSDMDILSILYPLRKQNKSILVVGFRNAVERCVSVARILNFPLKEFIVPYERTNFKFDLLKYKAEELIRKHKIDTIIGDQTAYVNLQSFCENLYLIKSNREDVLEAIGKTKSSLSAVQPPPEGKKKSRSFNGFTSRYRFPDIVTRDEGFLKVISLAKSYAQTGATILIEGESGVGKELFAQSIHSAGGRSNGPFIALNCAALSGQLLESELFGYADGAFTGAQKGGKQGLFELADTGTLFLDEISEMDVDLQAKFLRVLEEKKIRRIGSSSAVDVDVKIIAASNTPLLNCIRNNRFRPDLYYRINLLRLEIPPLRNRSGDIELLANHFLSAANSTYSLRMEDLTDEAIRLLKDYTWPGNTRELKNIIERLALTIQDGQITACDVRELREKFSGSRKTTLPARSGHSPDPFRKSSPGRPAAH